MGKMKSLLILGANSDIAEEVANKAAKQSIGLILAGRNIAKLQALKSDLEIRYGVLAYIARFDASNYGEHQKFYNDLPFKPDAVLCAFGSLGDQTQAEKDWSSCYQIIQENFIGAVSILNIIANDFETRKYGVIAGISSVAGERGRQSNYVYGASKAGFSTYLSGLRNRLFASGVHVLTIKPGFVKTKMLQGLSTSPLLTAQPQVVASSILKAMRNRTNTLYTKGIWRIVMFIIKFLPESIFKRLRL